MGRPRKGTKIADRPAVDICDEGLENLRAAILRRAVDDYEEALHRRMHGVADRPRNSKIFSKEQMEQFFLSAHGQTISGGRGEDLIEQTKKRARYFERRDGTTVLVATVETPCPDGENKIVSRKLKGHIERLEGSRVLDIHEAWEDD